MPGSHIPILSPEALKEHKPDWVLILPWNIADEVIEQMNSGRDWNMKFFKAMPVLTEI